MNKIEISYPKISLINCIGTPPNYPSKNTLAVADSGVNIHLAKQAATTMYPVIISNEKQQDYQMGAQWSHHT